MELIMINSDKMKIMLTYEDMAKYDIRIYALGHSGSAVREAFKRVLDDIKEQTGFETVAGKTVLQVYPARDGGCEVYITRLDSSGDYMQLKDNSSNTGTKLTFKSKLERVIFVFDALTDVMDACKLLTREGYSYKSCLYTENDKYFLILETESAALAILDGLLKLSDFGKRISGRLNAAYIAEHGQLVIASGAVEALGQ